MKKTFCLILFCFFMQTKINAQIGAQYTSTVNMSSYCYASDEYNPYYVPPEVGKTNTSSILRTFHSSFPNNMKGAVNFACDIWETVIESDVPIKVLFTKDNNGLPSNLFPTMPNDVIASGTFINGYENFSGHPSYEGPPIISDVQYPPALTNHLFGVIQFKPKAINVLSRTRKL